MKITTSIIFIIVIIIISGRVEQLHQTLGKVINVHLSNDGSMSAKMYFFLKPKKDVVLYEREKRCCTLWDIKCVFIWVSCSSYIFSATGLSSKFCSNTYWQTTFIHPAPLLLPHFLFCFFFSSDQHLAFILRRTFCRHTISQNIKLRRTSTFWKLSFWRYCNRPWQTYCFPPDIHVSKNTLFLLFKRYYRGDHGEETKNEDKLCSQWFR